MPKVGHGRKSEIVRERALDSLLSGATIAAAAEACGVNEKTVDSWLREPEFRSELLARSRAISDGAMAALIAANTAATSKMIELLESPDHRVALRAAETILTMAGKWIASDTEERLKRLEEILDEQLNQKS